MKNLTKIKLWLIFLSFISISISEAQQNYKYTTYAKGVHPRTYIIHTPPSHPSAKKSPVVFVFHGGTNAEDIKTRTKFDSIGDIENFITVFPQAYIIPPALTGLWADTRLTAADIAGIDDVGFISFIIDTLISKFNIDTTKIFVAGLSAGGYFCQRLALQLNNRIAAFACVASSLTTSLIPYFPPSRKIPMLFMNGTADTRNPYFGGLAGSVGYAVSTETAFTHWASLDNCFVSFPTVYEFPDKDPTYPNPSTVTRITYYPCHYNSEVVLYRINKGGHTWPGGKNQNVTVLGPTNFDINASYEIWLFFKRHQLLCPGGGDPVDRDGDLIPDFCDSCPLDANNDLDGDAICGNIDNCPNHLNVNQEDFDIDGIGDNCDLIVNVDGACEHLIIIIQSFVLPGGVENSLIPHIVTAMNRCKSGINNPSIANLEAFIKEVKAKPVKDLKKEEADQLISFAQALINAIKYKTIAC